MPPPALVSVCVLFHMVVEHNSEVNGYLQISHQSCTPSTISVASCVYIYMCMCVSITSCGSMEGCGCVDFLLQGKEVEASSQ